MRRLACLIVFLLLPFTSHAAPVHGMNNAYLNAPNRLAIFDMRFAPELEELSRGRNAFLDWDRRGGLARLGPRGRWLDVDGRIDEIFDRFGNFGFIGVEGLRRAAGFVLQGLTTAQVLSFGRGRDDSGLPSLLELNALSATERLLSEVARGDEWNFMAEQQSAPLAPVPVPAGLPLLMGAVGLLALRRR